MLKNTLTFPAPCKTWSAMPKLPEKVDPEQVI